MLMWVGALLTAVWAALEVLPFPRLRRVLSRLARTRRDLPAPVASAADINRIVWAIGAAGRALPVVGTCLMQALVGYVLLARRGYPTDLRIGVARDEAGKFVAHAWLERDGDIVIGQLGAEHQRYTPLSALRGLEPSR